MTTPNKSDWIEQIDEWRKQMATADTSSYYSQLGSLGSISASSCGAWQLGQAQLGQTTTNAPAPDWYYYTNGTNLTQTPTPKVKDKNMMQSLKEYVGKYKDTLFTVGFILVVDHFVFNGALKNKIQDTLENMLSGVKNKLGEIKDECSKKS